MRSSCSSRARAGDSEWFTVARRRAADAAAEVADVTRARYPDLRIPYHSRWRHFEAGGVDRKAELDARLAATTADRARAMIDLTVVSVLLDAGAGPGLALSRGQQRAALHPVRGAGRGELARLLPRSVLRRPGTAAAGRRRQVCAVSPWSDWPRRSSAHRRTRWWVWKAACRCCAGWAMRCLTRRGRPADFFDLLIAADQPDRRTRHPVASAGVAVGYLVGGQQHWPRRARATAGATTRYPDPA